MYSLKFCNNHPEILRPVRNRNICSVLHCHAECKRMRGRTDAAYSLGKINNLNRISSHAGPFYSPVIMPWFYINIYYFLSFYFKLKHYRFLQGRVNRSYRQCVLHYFTSQSFLTIFSGMPFSSFLQG